MGNILDGLVKGISGFLPQDDPDVKILNTQTELRELSQKEEKIFARLGRAVYNTDGGESYPEIKMELEVLFNNRHAVEERLQAARDEKILREKAEAEERARREAEAEERARREAEERAHNCPNCGTYNPEGTNFCQGSGTGACLQTLLSQLRRGRGNRLSFLQRLRNKNRITRKHIYYSKEEIFMTFCTFCGTQVPDDIKFCTSCGKPTGIAVAPPPPVYAQPQAAAPPPQQIYTAPPPAQPYAAQPYAPAPDPNTLPPGSRFEPITTGGYIGIMLLMMLPVINIILLLIWACGGCRKVNKTNLARALLIMMLISTIISGIIFLIFGSMFNSGLNEFMDIFKTLGLNSN